MAADESEAILFCHREAPAAHLLLHTAAVHDQGIFGNKGSVLLQPGGAAVRVDGKENQITLGDGFFIQLSVDGTCQHGKGQHGFVGFRGVNRVAFQGVGPGHRAADEAEAENSYLHTRTSRKRWTRWFSSSN